MVKLKDYIIAEELDVDNLYFKVNTWYGQNEEDKTKFWSFMQKIINENPKSLDEFGKSINSAISDWKKFVNFAMNNINGTQEFDQLYVMKKIVDTLKNNKSLDWNI